MFRDVPPAVGRRLRAVGPALLDAALPMSCPVCHQPTGNSRGLCLSCWRSIRFLEEPWCERLGTPFPYDLGPGTLSAEAIANPPVFSRSRAAVAYDDTTAALVHAFKYADRTDLGPLMATWMARAGRDLLSAADLIVPVPLHRWRLLSRRYNQSALLAGSLAEFGGKPHVPLVLVRKRATRQQVGLSREGRAENVRGAFLVPPGQKATLQGRSVLLVDDVITTGATVEAATRALLRAGAAEVNVLAFARVVGGLA
ncbi:ComF family protein [Chthonobacter albigriseus]|uniref:ComF family protein n=1 Tax=Chthonobacter albigriseus TaxID=1683161 RepID=UPI00314013B3